MGLGTKIADKFRKDANFSRVGKGVVLGARGIRAGTGRYLTNKIPIVQWIPAYVPKWLISDVIAGQSVGLLLIPQAAVYALLAGVSVQQALLASWLPGIIYTIMGTSRGMNTAMYKPSYLMI
jgi:sodium-independent sulfate anion transporter 11